jgi:hypothetical protein
VTTPAGSAGRSAGDPGPGAPLRRLRLAAQGLAGRPKAAPAAAVRAVLAVQGQDLPAVRWSVGLRTAGATEASVGAAFADGSLVRSWPLRGTLHVVAAEDLAWLLALTSGRALASVAKRRELLGLEERDLELAREVAIARLEGGRALGRRELLAALEAGGLVVGGQRGYHVLWYLAQTGTLVLGPPDGRQQAFVLLREWLPETTAMDRDEALGELVARYVSGHGPVTAQDIARWAGLPLGEVRRGIAVAGARVDTTAIGGSTYLVAPGLHERPPADDLPLHLLPGFDEYILGYADRTSALAPEHADLVVPGANGMFKATVVVDGTVVGTWSRTMRAREVGIEVTLFPGQAAPDAAALLAAAGRYGAFLERGARLV